MQQGKLQKTQMLTTALIALVISCFVNEAKSQQWFVVDTLGRMGLGSKIPAAKLDVAGNVKIADGTQGAGKVLTSDANGLASWSTPLSLQIGTTSQTLYNNGTSWVASSALTNTGTNIGIGTSTPLYPLHFGLTTGLKICLYNQGAGYDGYAIGNEASELRFAGGTGTGDFITFKTQGYTNGRERLRITASGSVGIGTNVPSGLLELGLDQGRKPGTSTWTITSDARLKNIEGSYTKGLKEIMLLNPIFYHYKNVGERKFKEEVIKTQQIGFSAQDVQKVFPECVGKDADGYLNLNNHAIIVAQVNAIKEQQAQIEELKVKAAKVDDLQQQINELKSLILAQRAATSTVENVELNGKAYLSQNIPNPFKNTTTINCVVPDNNGSAYLKFYNQNGTVLKVVKLTGTGKNTVNLTANDLASGMYAYSLIVNETIVDTKQMLITQ